MDPIYREQLNPAERINDRRHPINLQLDRSDVSLPSHRWTNGWQPLKNIVTNGWLTEKPLKNHWSGLCGLHYVAIPFKKLH